jgi:nucleotide-binding universal stress UspA family protein
MFSQAVVATDLSPSSDTIVGCASTLGSLGVKHVVLVHVIDLDRAPSPADDALFAGQVASLEASGIAVSVETPLGFAPHAIIGMAAEHGAGLIVMGTRGQGLFHVGFSGSVSSDVIRLSPVPVLLAPQTDSGTMESGGERCGRALASVLVPVDLSRTSERCLALTQRLAPAHPRRITLVYVIESTFEALRGGAEQQARARLEEMAGHVRSAGVADVRAEVLRGTPDAVIAGAVSSGAYSLVVLAPRCLETIDQQFGSVSNAVLQNSTIPILVAPPGSATHDHPRGNT